MSLFSSESLLEIKKNTVLVAIRRDFNVRKDIRFLRESYTPENFENEIFRKEGTLSRLRIMSSRYGDKKRGLQVTFLYKGSEGESGINMSVIRKYLYRSMMTEKEAKKYNPDKDKKTKLSFQKNLETIVVIFIKLTPKPNASIESLQDCVVFKAEEFMYDPTMHIFNDNRFVDDIPDFNDDKEEDEYIIKSAIRERQVFTLITKSEEDELLKNLAIVKDRLKVFKLSDIIVRYYGWKIGQIVRIINNDPEIPRPAVESIDYRAVKK